MSTEETLQLDDLTPRELAVRIGDQEYKLVEPSEAAASRWRNALLAAAKVGPDGKITGMGNYAETSSLLVSSCLFRRSRATDQQGRPQYVPVTHQEVKTWPARHVAKLFERCKALGALSEGAGEDAEESREALEERLRLTRAKLDALDREEGQVPADEAAGGPEGNAP